MTNAPFGGSFDLPFSIHDGWPDALPGNVVSASEAGILLGGLLLDEPDWDYLSSTAVLTRRIDDHPATDGWRTEHPDGMVTVTEFDIPTSAVEAPLACLANSRAFGEWVQNTHGALGRLLIWDQSGRWWIVNEPDLEVQLICAPIRTFTTTNEPYEPFNWLPSVSDLGRRKITDLCARYQLR